MQHVGTLHHFNRNVFEIFPPESPQLKDLNSDVVEMYTSRSTPVVKKAQLNHNEDLAKLKSPWWKRLWDNDEQIIHCSDKNEELNF